MTEEETNNEEKKKNVILTVRVTTSREDVVIDSIETNIKNKKLPIKSLIHPEELRGYVFIEGDPADIEDAIKNVPYVRGIIRKEVPLTEIEKFIIPEKQEIKIEQGDVIEIITGPFKGEKGKITRTDETKKEITVELLEAAIPIPVTISVNSVRLFEKKKKA